MALAARPVRHGHGRGEGNDFLGELSCRPRRLHALLAADDVFVQGVSADAVLLRHEVGGLVHGPPDVRHLLLQRLIDEAVEVHVGLGEADALHPAGDDDAGFADGDPVGRHRGCRQAGTAVTVDGDARNPVAQPSPESRRARNVVAGRALRQAAAQHDVLHLAGLDAGPGYDLLEHVARHRDPVGLVERAAPGLGDAGTAVPYDSDVLHVITSATGCETRRAQHSRRPGGQSRQRGRQDDRHRNFGR